MVGGPLRSRARPYTSLPQGARPGDPCNKVGAGACSGRTTGPVAPAGAGASRATGPHPDTDETPRRRAPGSGPALAECRTRPGRRHAPARLPAELDGVGPRATLLHGSAVWTR